MGKHLVNENRRICRVCKNLLELSSNNFYKCKKSAGGFRYECKKCSTGSETRRWLITQSGNKCSQCKIYHTSFAFFDIDHIKPLRRRTNNIPLSRKHYAKKDIPNLQVLCPNCHRIKSLQD